MPGVPNDPPATDGTVKLIGNHVHLELKTAEPINTRVLDDSGVAPVQDP